MIRPDQIPDEVVEAFVHAQYGTGMTHPEVIAFALNAWPDVEVRPTFNPNRIILPLSHEIPDD